MLPFYQSVGVSMEERFEFLLLGFFSCLGAFLLTWVVTDTNPRLFPFWRRKFSFADRCDWCSRSGSFFHSAVVVFILFREFPFNLSVDWHMQSHSTRGVSWLCRSLCFSTGYFCYDLIVILCSRMSLWQVYVFHHIAGLTPIVITSFFGCEQYTVLVASFFFVEVCIFPLQFVTWCEHLKHDKGWFHKLNTHITFWLWIPSRLILPPIALTMCVTRVAAFDDVGGNFCFVPSFIGGFCICFFCIAVYFWGILPAYIDRVVNKAENQAETTSESPKETGTGGEHRKRKEAMGGNRPRINIPEGSPLSERSDSSLSIASASPISPIYKSKHGAR